MSGSRSSHNIYGGKYEDGNIMLEKSRGVCGVEGVDREEGEEGNPHLQTDDRFTTVLYTCVSYYIIKYYIVIVWYNMCVQNL